MYQTKNLGLNITEIDKDSLQAFNFDTDLGDNFKAIDEKTLSHRNITNCLLEVPQDIKLELVDGVLTLKEGSKVYIPNGFETDGTTKKFDEVTIDSGLTSRQNSASNDKVFLFSDKTRLMTATMPSLSVSELPNSPVGYRLYYNTTTNKCSYYASDGWIHDVSFPIGIATRSPNGFSSIDQVFNGFGYIGSTVFALPGVKGLIPDGINEDGSFNNIEYTVSDISTYTWNASYSGDYENIIFTNSVITGNSGWAEYKEKENVIWDNTTNSYFLALPFCNTTILNGVITSFTPKKPFRAVDYNDYQTKITELETKIATLQAAVEALQGS